MNLSEIVYRYMLRGFARPAPIRDRPNPNEMEQKEIGKGHPFGCPLSNPVEVTVLAGCDLAIPVHPHQKLQSQFN